MHDIQSNLVSLYSTGYDPTWIFKLIKSTSAVGVYDAEKTLHTPGNDLPLRNKNVIHSLIESYSLGFEKKVF